MGFNQERDFQAASTSPVWKEEITLPYVNSRCVTPVSVTLNEGMSPEKEFSAVSTQKNKRNYCLSRCCFSVPPLIAQINSRRK